MSDKIGFTPAPAGPGKDGYNPSYKDGKDNYHRKSKKRQDGEGEGSGPNAGDQTSKAGPERD